MTDDAAPDAEGPRYDGWSPATEELDDSVTASAAARLHGLLDAPGRAPETGDPLPPLWHWLTFLPQTKQSDLGIDGHPRRGGFLPPVALPRRMFVGGRAQFLHPVLVGEPLHRQGTVTSIETKTGRSGELVFVTVEYRVSGAAGISIIEEQDLVYRGRTPSGTGPSPKAGAEPTPPWQWQIDLDINPTLLFRFSALTYNAHRIHYDREWATVEEAYPGLVVHGPLQAIGMVELCRRNLPVGALRDFQFRSRQPAFDDGPLRLAGLIDDAGAQVTLHAIKATGHVATIGTGALNV